MGFSRAALKHTGYALKKSVDLTCRITLYPLNKPTRALLDRRRHTHTRLT